MPRRRFLRLRPTRKTNNGDAFAVDSRRIRSNPVTISCCLVLPVRQAHQETWSAPPLALLPIAQAAESSALCSIHHHRRHRRSQWPSRTSRANLSSTKVDFVQQPALVASLMPLPLKPAKINTIPAHDWHCRGDPLHELRSVHFRWR